MHVYKLKKVKVAHTRLPSVGFRSWSRFVAVSLQVTRVINPAISCYYFPPGLQLPPQPLRGLLPFSLHGEQMHNGCGQFAQDCYPIASRLRFESRSFCAWVQYANHSDTISVSRSKVAPTSIKRRRSHRNNTSAPTDLVFLEKDWFLRGT